MKVYVIDTRQSFDEDSLIDDDFFKKSAEEQGNVYTIGEFNNMFNNNEPFGTTLLNINNCYIKIL